MKIALLTGVCGGIGYSTAKKLLDSGMAVLGMDVLKEMPRALSGEFTYMCGDLSKKEDITKASVRTAFFDTVAAMLSALAIMPAVFAFGIAPKSGPPLMFITIPGIFDRMPMGRLFAVLFFL